ncbi:hypothetical protein M0804_005739 [Polistes exclamans]|nr:hypothetical protein M0804_005739 [Polistes exclamans]
MKKNVKKEEGKVEIPGEGRIILRILQQLRAPDYEEAHDDSIGPQASCRCEKLPAEASVCTRGYTIPT